MKSKGKLFLLLKETKAEAKTNAEAKVTKDFFIIVSKVVL